VQNKKLEEDWWNREHSTLPREISWVKVL